MNEAKSLPTLDAHAHVAPSRKPEELREAGCVLAMTLCLDEAELGLAREEPHIARGVGCHPRKTKWVEAFERRRFRELVGRAAFIERWGWTPVRESRWKSSWRYSARFWRQRARRPGS